MPAVEKAVARRQCTTIRGAKAELRAASEGRAAGVVVWQLRRCPPGCTLLLSCRYAVASALASKLA
eukprot:scaffold7374_cov112-Isochrysis_galbana.AAC.24